MLRTSKKRGGRSYLSGNREPIIPRTLGIGVVTCVSVYLGMPRGGDPKADVQGGSQDQPMPNRHKQYPLHVWDS